MFAVCFKYSSSREEAEDTFHEGFMKVFENIKDFRGAGSLEGWIRRIMVNTAIEKYRKNQRQIMVVHFDDHLNGYDSDHNASAEDMLHHMESEELMRLIHALPPQYKLVFNLYEFEGLKHKEIAEQLGITVGASKSNLSRAKALLQKAIIQQTNEETLLTRRK
jgi:RNA polymerase sigma-70 factor (ECF subfamily)